MRILILGADGKGSFEMRGRQLGHAIGARVTATPSPRDFAWADVIVLVKRAAALWGARAKQTGAPIVWDVVDVWDQPAQNQTPVEELRAQVLEMAKAIGVTTLIGTTKAMAADLGGVYLPHQCRPDMSPVAPRADARVVGYEGQAKYLGPWRNALEVACARLGYVFVVNPTDLRAVDVVVALRGGRWDGEVCRRWKSGVKFANAIVAGRPIVSQPCAGFDELAPIGAVAEGEASVESVLWMIEEVRDDRTRQIAYTRALERASEFSLSTIARQYREILTTSVMRAAA